MFLAANFVVANGDKPSDGGSVRRIKGIDLKRVILSERREARRAGLLKVLYREVGLVFFLPDQKERFIDEQAEGFVRQPNGAPGRPGWRPFVVPGRIDMGLIRDQDARVRNVGGDRKGPARESGGRGGTGDRQDPSGPLYVISARYKLVERHAPKAQDFDKRPQIAGRLEDQKRLGRGAISFDSQSVLEKRPVVPGRVARADRFDRLLDELADRRPKLRGSDASIAFP